MGGDIAWVPIQTNTSKPRQVTATADSQRDREADKHAGSTRREAGCRSIRGDATCPCAVIPCGTRLIRTLAVAAAECVKSWWCGTPALSTSTCRLQLPCCFSQLFRRQLSDAHKAEGHRQPERLRITQTSKHNTKAPWPAKCPPGLSDAPSAWYHHHLPLSHTQPCLPSSDAIKPLFLKCSPGIFFDDGGQIKIKFCLKMHFWILIYSDYY